MNIAKLNDAVEKLKTDLGQGLLSTDIWFSADGQSIAGYNHQPKATALFNRITKMINSTLSESGFPELAKYYLLDLVDNKIVIVIPMDEYQWGMLLDSTKAPLGLLLNIAVPHAITSFEEALIG